MRKKILIWSLLSVLSILIYLTVWMISQYDTIIFNLNDPDRSRRFITAMLQIFERRTFQVIALILSSVLIVYSTLSFQTLTNNRIITPSLLGFDSIYVVVQTTIVYFFSSVSIWILDPILNFIISVTFMTGITILMFRTVLKKNKNNILLLLLIGMVISTLASNYAQFLQILMDPNEFQTISQLTSVSVVNINHPLTIITLPFAIFIVVYFLFKTKVLDVMSLGESHAKNLGVDYPKESMIQLIMISISISLVTALVGPLSFLGLIAVNIAKELYKKYHHLEILILGSLVAIVILVFGQSVVELLGFQTTVSTFMNLAGGIYMIYLIVKEHQT